MAQEWIVRRADQEKQRRVEYAVLRQAAFVFQGKITAAVHECLDVYNSLFPGERRHIQITSEGTESVIRRTGEPGIEYAGTLPEVRLTTEIPGMIMSCTFPHRLDKNVEFKLVQLEDGSVGLAEGSIESACECILGPILFHKLAD